MMMPGRCTICEVEFPAPEIAGTCAYCAKWVQIVSTVDDAGEFYVAGEIVLALRAKDKLIEECAAFVREIRDHAERKYYPDTLTVTSCRELLRAIEEQKAPPVANAGERNVL